jgi:hypothetical protein
MLLRIRASGTLLLIALGVGSCTDAVEPNTDVGLRVTATVLSRSVSIGDTSGSYTVRVTLRPAHGVRLILTLVDTTAYDPVSIPTDPSAGAGQRVALRTGTAVEPFNAGPNLTEWGTIVDTIPAGGIYSDYVVTLREWATGGWPLVPGTYQVRVWYNMREGQPATLTLVP